MNAKRLAAEQAVDYVHDNMVVGLGTGSTAYWAIRKLGLMVQSGLNISAIATSVGSEELAKELGIKLVSFSDINEIDITIDGADEVDKDFNLIKGGGGALLREKIVATSSKEFIVVVDESKMVESLGKFPLPVEIIKFGYEATIKKLESLGCEPHIRIADDKVYVTDNGNYIIDCNFGKINDPKELQNKISLIPGVVDSGLFVNAVSRVIVGHQNGLVKEITNYIQ